MRLSFVLIMEASIKSPLHQDKAVTGVARGTRLLKEPRFWLKRVMTPLQLLWKQAWLKEEIRSWGVWGTNKTKQQFYALRRIWQWNPDCVLLSGSSEAEQPFPICAWCRTPRAEKKGWFCGTGSTGSPKNPSALAALTEGGWAQDLWGIWASPALTGEPLEPWVAVGTRAPPADLIISFITLTKGPTALSCCRDHSTTSWLHYFLYNSDKRTNILCHHLLWAMRFSPPDVASWIVCVSSGVTSHPPHPFIYIYAFSSSPFYFPLFQGVFGGHNAGVGPLGATGLRNLVVTRSHCPCPHHRLPFDEFIIA